MKAFIKENKKNENCQNKDKMQDSTKMREKRTVPKILNLIYPPTCGICGKLNQDFLCKKCEKILDSQAVFQIDKFDESNKFDKMNKNDKVIEDNFSFKSKNFENHLYIFKYEGIIRNTIIKYKFSEKSYLYKTFVNFLLKNEKFFKILKSYDKIIPVPISKKRKKQRGYNQSELIAKELAKKLKIDLDVASLLKQKDIIEQSKLNKEERLDNIKGAYLLQNSEENILKDKKIILIDDVFTTGSTVDECSSILKKANPKKIDVLTIAKD